MLGYGGKNEVQEEAGLWYGQMLVMVWADAGLWYGQMLGYDWVIYRQILLG